MASRLVTVALCALALLVAAPGASAAGERFPHGFLWGTAIAGFQTEMGGSPSHADRGSDWWVWSHDARNIAAGVVSGDLPERGPGHWHAYRRDLRLARRSLHNGAFRLSIEWSRIFPRSTAGIQLGRRLDRRDLRRLDRLANRAAVRHYTRELRAIRRLGMVAFVTLNHYTLPLWLHDPLRARAAFAGLGPNDPPPRFAHSGWLSRATVREFRKYAAYLAWKLGRYVRLWAPVNEPMVVVMSGYLAGNFPPGVFSFGAAVAAVRNLELANSVAYDAVHRFDRHARVGLVHNMVAFTPAHRASARDRAGTRHADYLFNRLLPNAEVRGDLDANADGVIERSERRLHGRKADFVGVNYYFRGRISGRAATVTPLIPLLDFRPRFYYRAPECPTTCSDFGNELYPRGFGQVLRTAGRYRLPVYVTENGISDANDNQRPAFLLSHLRVLRRAMHDGLARVRGYFHWSLMDNFEWAEGYRQHFGLYSFDPLTLRRHARPSARLYARIARRNRLP